MPDSDKLFDDKQAAFLRIITEGGTWRSAAIELKVSTATISRWISEDAEFEKLYARACDVRADAIFEEMIEIADNGVNDWMERNYGDETRWVENGEALRRSALRIETRKWLLGKMKPKVYGDKSDVTITHRKADGLSDDELAHIASGSGTGAAAPKVH